MRCTEQIKVVVPAPHQRARSLSPTSTYSGGAVMKANRTPSSLFSNFTYLWRQHFVINQHAKSNNPHFRVTSKRLLNDKQHPGGSTHQWQPLQGPVQEEGVILDTAPYTPKADSAYLRIPNFNTLRPRMILDGVLCADVIHPRMMYSVVGFVHTIYHAMARVHTWGSTKYACRGGHTVHHVGFHTFGKGPPI